MKNLDIFDIIAQKNKKDIFTTVKVLDDEEKKIEETVTKSNSDILNSIKAYVRANRYVPPPPQPPVNYDEVVSSRLPPPLDVDALIKDVQKRVLNNLPPPPVQIVVEKKETVIQKVPGPTVDNEARKMFEEVKAYKEILDKLDKQLSEYKKEIKKLEEKIDKKNDDVIIIGAKPPSEIPAQNDQSGKYLTTNGHDLSWASVSATGSGGYWGTGTEAVPVDGDWHIVIDGDNLSVQKYETGAWAEKGVFLP